MLENERSKIPPTTMKRHEPNRRNYKGEGGVLEQPRVPKRLGCLKRLRYDSLPAHPCPIRGFLTPSAAPRRGRNRCTLTSADEGTGPKTKEITKQTARGQGQGGGCGGFAPVVVIVVVLLSH